jgi:cytochrome c5
VPAAIGLGRGLDRQAHPAGGPSIELRDASAPVVLQTGEQVYQAQCAACHATGAAGAPKLGDAAAWAPRIKTGYDALLTSALKGKGAMGAQGGGDFSTYEIARAVVYLANQGGGKFDEPKAPAAAASAAELTPRPGHPDEPPAGGLACFSPVRSGVSR